MTLLRRVSYGALALAFTHIVFGAIVRITGSGLGCGDHWPRCHGYWFPPFTRMDLVIEVMHRYLAFGLSLTIMGLLVLAFVRRREPGVGGPGGILRPVALASVLVVSAALFGALTVKYELRNKGVIVVHLAIAISTLAALAMATIRAGGLGGAQATAGTASEKTWRGARVAAALAFAAVVLGGFTAHIVGANGACVGFPHCPRGIPTPGAPLHVHLTHRVVAFLLFFHLLGMVFAVRKRAESALIQWAVRIAFGTVLLQILVAAALVETFLPPMLKSLHQAVGTLVWLSIFVLAVLARRGSRGVEDGARPVPPAPRVAPEPGALRGGAALGTTAATGAASLVADVSALPAPATLGASATLVAVSAPMAPRAIDAAPPIAEFVEVAMPAAPAPIADDEAEEIEHAIDFDATPVVSIEPEVLLAMTGEHTRAAVVAPAPIETPAVEAVVAVEAVEVEEALVEEAMVAEEAVAVAAIVEAPVVEEPVVEVSPVDSMVFDEPAIEQPTTAEVAIEPEAIDVAAEAGAEPAVVGPTIEESTIEESTIEESTFEEATLEDPTPVPSLEAEVAARLESVVGRDPFDDDEDDVLVAEDEELDADDDFAAAMAAAFPDEADDADDAAAEVAAESLVTAEAESLVDVVAVTIAEPEPAVDAAPVLAAPVLAAPVLAAPVLEAPVLAAPVVAEASAVAAQVAVLPTPPKRPPTLAVLIARGADF